MPAGRPSSYDTAYCEQVIALGKDGKSQVQISAAIDIPRTTMLSWGEAQPEFSTALMRAKELEQAWWEDKAQENLSERNFNAALWAKNVASRFRADYGERTEVTGKDGAPLVPQSTSDIAAALLGVLAGAKG